MNTGLYPLDANTNVGKFRLTIGDTVATNITGDQGDYSYFSDAEITQFLFLGGDSVPRAVGFAYRAWAGQAAAEAAVIKDFDLQVDYTKRAAALSDQADFWFAQADADDANAADAVQIVPTGVQYEWPAEAVSRFVL